MEGNASRYAGYGLSIDDKDSSRAPYEQTSRADDTYSAYSYMFGHSKSQTKDDCYGYAAEEDEEAAEKEFASDASSYIALVEGSVDEGNDKAKGKEKDKEKEKEKEKDEKGRIYRSMAERQVPLVLTTSKKRTKTDYIASFFDEAHDDEEFGEDEDDFEAEAGERIAYISKWKNSLTPEEKSSDQFFDQLLKGTAYSKVIRPIV